jgi:hypothetical protein
MARAFLAGGYRVLCRPRHRLTEFCRYPESLQAVLGYYLKLGHGHFLPKSFQFITHHYLTIRRDKL